MKSDVAIKIDLHEGTHGLCGESCPFLEWHRREGGAVCTFSAGEDDGDLSLLETADGGPKLSSEGPWRRTASCMLTEVRRLAEKHGAWERVGLSLLPEKELRALVCELDCDKGLLEDVAALLSSIPDLLAEIARKDERIVYLEGCVVVRDKWIHARCLDNCETCDIGCPTKTHPLEGK